ncbi:receptor-like protein EIX2 isoform X2 [Salvia divinorum]|uniref:Receptor-like protein EIX2 isoform X2 n=1 Tax=Salvia divinorum TaxID=28513 RepID=A0ABD1HIM4_SALDI
MISDKRIAINFLPVVLFCVIVSGDAEVRCIDREREALLTFKNGLIDDRGILSSWQSDECCDWYGVECSNTTSHVITLQCDYCGLQGELESRSIYFGRCNVGPSFPKWIQTQRNLSVLDLRGANITDETPSWLWSRSSLLYSLFLSDNQMSGHIPLFPANAIDIQLSGNKFSGIISSICKTNHNGLIFLDLSNNQLAGEVPDCREKLPNLHSLNLASNKFSGEIPFSLGSLQNSVALHMHGNNLSGELPYNLRLCQKLRIIDVGGNKLTGEIPTWIGQMHQLQFLNLRGNKLHGSIPPEICILDLSINNLSSIIPDCFNNFIVLASKSTTYLDPFLFSIYFYSNNENKHYGYSLFQWKGKEFGYKTNLEFLKLIDFSSNRLTGNIPKSFSNMRDLNSLNLSRNSLSGCIIPDIGKLEMLDSLDLSLNQLSGKIPTSLAEIYTLGFLDLSNNSLLGEIPMSTQLQSFNASAYAGNHGLCGDPLPKCPEDSLSPSTTNLVDNMNEKDNISLLFMQKADISMTKLKLRIFHAIKLFLGVKPHTYESR